MTIRRLLAVVVVSGIVVGCGGSSVSSRPATFHLDGQRTQSDYVFETDAAGTRFVVPVSVLASQRDQAFDVAAPTLATGAKPNDVVAGTPPAYRFGVAFATATVPQSAHVEVLVTGNRGRRFALSWTDTCGWTKTGHGAVGGTGGQGVEIVRSPAVTLVRLPSISRGVPSCYLAATASTATFTRAMHLGIIDY